ncbi:colicin immunity domain-containing protein [Pinibacter aurantiacus]|uniref:Magnesium and cobalt transport protein CorA n=1 Tax=Pinibacter aurantiacus TaxID=2851599 RepID=A0A9E2SDA9_9BACT|nr:colicin immunity domain-containing protein [Pinibacter aurantiacus]MBV4360611.1 hypothetical protein [Pinibacter aurantiacus]
MFEKNDKRRLYWLLDQYLSGKINASIFCDEFYYSYDLELDYSSLTELEHRLFSELSTVAGRFSEYEEDHLALPEGFYTKEELKQKIIETKEKLEHHSPQ